MSETLNVAKQKIGSYASMYGTEFITFACISLLVFLLFVLFYNHSIERDVRKNSRCKRERDLGKVGGTYIVQAMNASRDPLYKVSYDLTGKQTRLECACKPGDVGNTFRNIPLFNMGSRKTDIIETKHCGCEVAYDQPGSSVYYEGYPSLVSHMRTSGRDETFFEMANLKR